MRAAPSLPPDKCFTDFSKKLPNVEDEEIGDDDGTDDKDEVDDSDKGHA